MGTGKLSCTVPPAVVLSQQPMGLGVTACGWLCNETFPTHTVPMTACVDNSGLVRLNSLESQIGGNVSM